MDTSYEYVREGDYTRECNTFFSLMTGNEGNQVLSLFTTRLCLFLASSRFFPVEC